MIYRLLLMYRIGRVITGEGRQVSLGPPLINCAASVAGGFVL